MSNDLFIILCENWDDNSLVLLLNVSECNKHELQLNWKKEKTGR